VGEFGDVVLFEITVGMVPVEFKMLETPRAVVRAAGEGNPRISIVGFVSWWCCWCCW